MKKFSLFLSIILLVGNTLAEDLVIDVRTVEEWNEGHLSLAKNIEWQDIGIEIQEVALVKEQRIIVYCRSGKRAGKAFITLTNLGYTNVINAGGLNDAQKLLGGDIVK